MANALRDLPDPVTEHGPRTRHVVLNGCHSGQIVTPVVRAWYVGKGYLVQLSAYDAGDRTYAEPSEFVGDFWSCTDWLLARGVRADIDAA